MLLKLQILVTALSLASASIQPALNVYRYQASKYLRTTAKPEGQFIYLEATPRSRATPVYTSSQGQQPSQARSDPDEQGQQLGHQLLVGQDQNQELLQLNYQANGGQGQGRNEGQGGQNEEQGGRRHQVVRLGKDGLVLSQDGGEEIDSGRAQQDVHQAVKSVNRVEERARLQGQIQTEKALRESQLGYGQSLVLLTEALGLHGQQGQEQGQQGQEQGQQGEGRGEEQGQGRGQAEGQGQGHEQGGQVQGLGNLEGVHALLQGQNVQSLQEQLRGNDEASTLREIEANFHRQVKAQNAYGQRLREQGQIQQQQEGQRHQQQKQEGLRQLLQQEAQQQAHRQQQEAQQQAHRQQQEGLRQLQQEAQKQAQRQQQEGLRQLQQEAQKQAQRQQQEGLRQLQQEAQKQAQRQQEENLRQLQQVAQIQAQRQQQEGLRQLQQEAQKQAQRHQQEAQLSQEEQGQGKSGDHLDDGAELQQELQIQIQDQGKLQEQIQLQRLLQQARQLQEKAIRGRARVNAQRRRKQLPELQIIQELITLPDQGPKIILNNDGPQLVLQHNAPQLVLQNNGHDNQEQGGNEGPGGYQVHGGYQVQGGDEGQGGYQEEGGYQEDGGNEGHGGYKGEEETHHAPRPYSFKYISPVENHGQSYHQEKSDHENRRVGSYGYKTADGVFRHVDYVADKGGFRATVRSNEPGLAHKNPSNVKIILHPSPRHLEQHEERKSNEPGSYAQEVHLEGVQNLHGLKK